MTNSTKNNLADAENTEGKGLSSIMTGNEAMVVSF